MPAQLAAAVLVKPAGPFWSSVAYLAAVPHSLKVKPFPIPHLRAVAMLSACVPRPAPVQITQSMP
jgi:hypothetical protein